MGMSYEELEKVCTKWDKEFVSKTMAMLLWKLIENGVSIKFYFCPEYYFSIYREVPFNESEFEFDFSKHDEQLLKTKFMTCAELEKVRCENKELKSQCECLKKEIEKLPSADNELIDQPIRIAEKLIYATGKCPVSQIHKAFGCKEDTVDIDVYSKPDLRQIANHLLVYCDDKKEME